jgi:non-ribosomal peptide synthetase component F
VAVEIGEERMTYEELNARANQLAHYLRTLGIGSEVLVGLCMERSVEVVVGLLGILKAGGAYVPLDPSYPAQRLAFMLEDTRAAVLLTSAGLLSKLPAGAGQRLCVDTEWAKVAGQPATNPAGTGRSSDLAYVIYTSGSTGTPKGVMIEHRALVNHMEWMRRAFHFNSGDSVLQKTSISFDAAMWEVFVPLLVGGRLVLGAPDVHLDPRSSLKRSASTR